MLSQKNLIFSSIVVRTSNLAVKFFLIFYYTAKDLSRKDVPNRHTQDLQG